MDALTPKQLLFLSFLKRDLERKGHYVILSCRRGMHLEDLASALGEKPVIIGGYGKTLASKLKADAERVRELSEKVAEWDPQLLVSYPNPSAVRVAFGLGVRIVIYTDTPHAVHAHRLSIPLTDFLVHSRLIDPLCLRRYVLSKYTVIVRYNGVDELAWVNKLPVNDSILRELGLRPGEYVVARPPEIHAAYYRHYDTDPVLKIIEKLSREITVVVLPRYEEDARRYGNTGCIVLKKLPLAASLLRFSKLVITGGGTLAREAALMGVPGISVFPYKLELNDALSALGFPLYRIPSVKEAYKKAIDIITGKETVDGKRIESLTRSLEEPIKPLLRILKYMMT